jgi:hypothetical protein
MILSLRGRPENARVKLLDLQVDSLRRSLRSSKLESCPTRAGATHHMTPPPLWVLRYACGYHDSPCSSRDFLVLLTRELLGLGRPGIPQTTGHYVGGWESRGG